MTPACIVCIVSASSDEGSGDGGAGTVCPAESIAAGLAVAYRSLGLSTAAFQVDISSCVQAHHSSCSSMLANATGRDVMCISPWLAGATAACLQGFINQHAQGADVVLVVSGNTSGLHGPLPLLSQALKSCCTTAQIGRLLNAPCLLVVKAGEGRAFVDCVRGQLAPDPSLPLAGIIVQHTGHGQHPSVSGLQSQLQTAGLDTRVVGIIPALPNCPEASIPSLLHRHIDIDSVLAACTAISKQGAHTPKAGRLLNALTAKAAAALTGVSPATPVLTDGGERPSARIAVAQDEAFMPCFPGDLAALQVAGAVIETFSPLHDSHLPSGCQGVLLGGMQELTAMQWHQLSENTSMRAQLKSFCDAGGVVLAQYTGLVYLSRAVAPEGQTAGHHIPLVGVLPFRALLQPSSSPAMEACVELTVTQAASHLLVPTHGSISSKGSHSSGQPQQVIHAFLHSRVDLVEELRHSLGPWGTSNSPGVHTHCSQGGYSSAFSASAAEEEHADASGKANSKAAGGVLAEHGNAGLVPQPRKRQQQQQQKRHTWLAGYCTGNVLASAMHWPFSANPPATEAWVAACSRVDASTIHKVLSSCLDSIPTRTPSPQPSSPFKTMACCATGDTVPAGAFEQSKQGSLSPGPLLEQSKQSVSPAAGMQKSRTFVETASPSVPAAAAAAALPPKPVHNILRFSSCMDLSSAPKPLLEAQPPWPTSTSMPGRLQHQTWAYDMHLLQQQQRQVQQPVSVGGSLTTSQNMQQEVDHGLQQDSMSHRPSCILEAEEAGLLSSASSCKATPATCVQPVDACLSIGGTDGGPQQHTTACAAPMVPRDATIHVVNSKTGTLAGSCTQQTAMHVPFSARSSCENDVRQHKAAPKQQPAPSHHTRSGSHTSMQGLCTDAPDVGVSAMTIRTSSSHTGPTPGQRLSLNKSSSMYALSSLGPDGSTGSYWASDFRGITDAIVSLCPGATEVLVALGLQGRLAGITDACDWPDNLKGTTPVACRHNRSSTVAAAVTAQTSPTTANNGSPRWQSRAHTDSSLDWQQTLLVDEDLLREERPSVVVLPELERLSVQDRAALHRALHRTVLHPATAPHERAAVVSMASSALATVLQSILQIGEAASVPQAACALVEGLRSRARKAARTAVSTGIGAPKVRVLVLSALQPVLMRAGGCVPEMLSLLGAVQATTTKSQCHDAHDHAAVHQALEPGEGDVPLTWEQLLLLGPDVLVIAGSPVSDTLAQLAQLAVQPGWWGVPAVRTGMVFVMQAPLLLRPGPRLIDGLECLADILANYHSACGPSSKQASLPLQPIMPAPGTWRTFLTGQGRDAATQIGKGGPTAQAGVMLAAGPRPPVLKLSLSGGQRCRPSLLPNYFIPWLGRSHAQD